MSNFSFVLLHVEDHAASAIFYNELLGIPIIEQKADFAMLPLREGVMLGLWARATVEPRSSGHKGACELAFTETDANALHAKHAEWQQRGVDIIQSPTEMSFGTTFVALDPDGHRLRVFAPPAA